jgi:hypothetical protein
LQAGNTLAMALSSPINLSEEELSPIHLARSQSFADITPQPGCLTLPGAGGRFSAAGAIRPGNLITGLRASAKSDSGVTFFVQREHSNGCSNYWYENRDLTSPQSTRTSVVKAVL